MRTEKMNKKAIKLLEALVVERIKEELKDDKAYEKYLKFISYVEQQDLNESTENLQHLGTKRLGGRSVSQSTIDLINVKLPTQSKNDQIDVYLEDTLIHTRKPSILEDVDKMTMMSSLLQKKMQHPQSINSRWMKEEKPLGQSVSVKTFHQGAQLITQLTYEPPLEKKGLITAVTKKDQEKSPVEGITKDKEWEDFTYLMTLKNQCEDLEARQRERLQKEKIKSALDK